MVKLVAVWSALAVGWTAVEARAAFREAAAYGDVDCAVSEWEYGECNAYGFQTRSRQVLVAPEGAGAACPPLSEEVPCAPEHCEVGPWSEFSPCDDSGFKTRTRAVLKEPRNGGSECPDLTEQVSCKKVDCRVCEWSDWKCDELTGLKARRRHVIAHPRDGGEECPHLEETESCDAIDCKESCWTEWTECEQHDDGWYEVRTREIEQEPLHGGRECGDLVERNYCPPEHCVESAWTEWSQCYEDGDKWVQKRTRTIEHAPKYGGTACGPTEELKECPPVDCSLSDWTNWGECAGDGYEWHRKRTRSIVVEPLHGGKTCDHLEETEKCKPVCCKVSGWGEWSECMYDGYEWYKMRTRSVRQEPKYGGTPCPSLEQREPCPKVDCEVTEWSEWSTCGFDGYGWYKKRTRSVTVEAQYGGEECPATEEQELCAPVHCEVSEWSDFSECKDMGDGWWQTRTRTVTQEPKYGGNECPTLENRQFCPPENCELTSWGEWSECQEEGYEWLRTKTREVSRPAKYGGAECEELEKREKCEPIDCKVSEWLDWHDCKEDGDKWYKTRERDVTQEPKYGGAECPNLDEREVCDPRDCDVSCWSKWSECIDEGYSWTHVRTRTVNHGALYGGKECPPLEESKPCDPIDCEVSSWSDWGECHEDPYGWFRLRTREVVTEPKYGGQECPELEEPEHCEPVDCKVSGWSEWSECMEDSYSSEWYKVRTQSVVQEPKYGGEQCPLLEERLACPPRHCELGDWSAWGQCNEATVTKRRTREIVTSPLYGGDACDSLIEEAPCDPVDCEVSEWCEWSVCDEYTGKRTRTRKVTQVPKWGGKQCDALVEEKPCDPVDCEVCEWSQWSACDAVTGKRTRTRSVDVAPKWGGDECPALEEHEDCAPEHCEVSEWSEWSVCNHATGKKSRRRLVSRSPRFGGNECGDLVEEQCCDPVDCEVSDWSEWSGCNCKSGLRSRTRLVLSYNRYGGAACPALEENEECNPVDCHLGEWTAWSACDAETGKQTRTRPVLTYPNDGGEPCGETLQTRDCPAVDCKVGEWSEWSQCDESKGLKTRSLAILQYAEHGGEACPKETVQRAPCDPIDCKVSEEYGPWGKCCQSTCTRKAERIILSHEKFGGRRCDETPYFVKEEACYEGGCAEVATE